MPTEHDMTPVELPYTFTPTEQIPYGHYNTKKINPMQHNEGLLYNTVHNTWSTKLQESTSEIPEEYELQQNTEISKRIKPYIIPGEENSLHNLPLYYSGPTIDELIYKINHPNEEYPGNNNQNVPIEPDTPPADPVEVPVEPGEEPWTDPTYDPSTNPDYDPSMDPTYDPWTDPNYDPTTDPNYEP